MANTARLVIDPIARKISTKYEKIRLVQNDNNSMRITFEMPRYVRGHDMSNCSTVEVHYDNISIDRKQINSDVYFVDDIEVATEDDTTINFSWLVSRNATQIVGSVEFSLHFGYEEDPSLEYAWHTTTYSGISVLVGKHNTEAVVDNNPDAFTALQKEIDERKLDKITDVSQTGNFGGVYALNTNGTQGMIKVTNQTGSGSIPIRGSGGVIVGGTPTADAHLTTKKYVDDLADTKVSKDNSTGGWWAYCRKQGEEKMLRLNTSPAEWSLPLYGTNGVIYTNDPTLSTSGDSDKACTNKKYVDDLAATKTDEWEGATGGYYTFRARYMAGGESKTATLRAHNQPLASSLSTWNGDKQLSTEAPTGDKHCANKKYVDDADNALKARLDLLELAAEGNIFAFVEDDSAAYKKAVPSTAFSNAIISKLGGAMGHDEYGLLVESPVTRLENHGKNLFDESAITQAASSKAETSTTHGSVENGYLKAKRAAYSTTVLWLPFKMTLDVGKYAVSADVYVGSQCPGLKVYMGVGAGKGSTNLKTKQVACSSYDTWQRMVVVVDVTESDEYYFAGCGGGAASNYVDLDVRFKNIQVEKADAATEFAPYRAPITIYEIPQAIRNLAGYGLGINKNLNNHIDFESKTLVRMVDKRMWETSDEERNDILTDAIWTIYPLDEVETVDISKYLDFDGEIEVEANGAIVAVNEYAADIPSTITYQVKI